MGKLGVMHQLFGGLRIRKVVHSMFEHVNGLSAEADAYDSDDDENALKSKKKISNRSLGPFRCQPSRATTRRWSKRSRRLLAGQRI